MKNMAIISKLFCLGIFAIVTANADIFSIHGISSNLQDQIGAYQKPNCIEKRFSQDLKLTKQNGEIASNEIQFSTSECKVPLPNFSMKTHALIVRVIKMTMRIACPGCDPMYCRRDVLLFGENLCKYEPGTCLIFQSTLQTDSISREQLNACNKQYWIIQKSFEDNSPSISISNPIEGSVSNGKQFSLQYSFVPLYNGVTKTVTSTSSGLSTSDDQKTQPIILKTEYIIAICMGVVIFALVITIIFICACRTKPQSNVQASNMHTPDENNVYSTPADAYSNVTENAANKYKNGTTYDTLII